MQVTVIIPSLDPDERLAAVVEALTDGGFTDIVLVDDGSDAAHRPLFARLAALPQVTVLTHKTNRGKGRAIKTGLAYVLEHRPDSRGAVTVDGDGQHAAADVRRLAQALLADGSRVYLGARDFRAAQVPARSRFGNRTTCLVLRLLCGIRVRDSQTGLRAFPRRFLPSLLQVPGERFEYETNMLLEFADRHIPYAELPIDTIYIEKNESSHFRPVQDSWRIYRLILRRFFRFAGSSLLAALLDILLFTLFGRCVFRRQEPSLQILLATVSARLISSLFNFAVNRLAVFRSKSGLLSTLWRYYALCAAQMLASAGLVALLRMLLPLPQELLKCVIDLCLFFVSYRVQASRVFRTRV